MRKKLLFMLTILCVGMLASCSDDDGTTSGNGAEQQEESSARDDQPWPLTQYMDSTNYRAGDNFFMYCNGTYWKNTDPGYTIKGFYESEMEDALKQLKADNKSPLHDQLRALQGKQLTNDELYQFLKPFYDRIDGIQNYEDAFRVAGQLKVMGANSIFSFSLIGNSKNIDAILYAGDPTNCKNLYEPFLTSDHPGHVFQHEAATPYEKSDGIGEYWNQVQEMVLKHLWPALNLPDKHFVYAFYFEHWLTTPIDELKAFMKMLVFSDFAPVANAKGFAYMQKNFPTEETTATPAEWATLQVQSLIKYLDSRTLIQRYITPQLKAEVTQMCEEMRQAFIARIRNITWMSATTKQKAISKVEHITFHIGGPDQWMADTPDLSHCNNLAEAMRELNIQYIVYEEKAIGMRQSDDYFNSNNYRNTPLLKQNCYYEHDDNIISIFPPYMLPPFYSADMHLALKYGMLMEVIGHELTHSIDASGSMRTEDGAYQAWWTIQDQSDYEDRQQKLITLYNRLPVYEGFPGFHTDGKNSLNENIADLGGLEIAHDAFVAHCQQLGFRGTALDEMERKFFQAYANYFRSVYTSSYCLDLLKSDHALNKERVNGVVMNIDRWYELYNVQWGDYLYLKPENRTHIW